MAPKQRGGTGDGRVASRSRRRKKKKAFPPAPNWPRSGRAGDEAALLEEGEWNFQPLIWQRVRDVRVWSQCPRELRMHLFAEDLQTWQLKAEREASALPELAAPIRTLSALVRYPELIHPEDVRTACITISEWADSNHLPRAALCYAEAAAAADPMSAMAAAHAGEMCARHAEDVRAQLWYERAIRIGRQTGDWEWYVRGLIRLGILEYTLGSYRRARRFYFRARNKALWAGLEPFAGKAHHDMMRIESVAGSYTAGARHALAALQFYPVNYSRLPHLLHDIAFLFSSFGAYAEARELLNVVLPHITKPFEKIAVFGTLAYAAACLGDVPLYRACVEDVLILKSMSDLNASAALVLCAEGAWVLDEFDRAAHLTALARDVALKFREREPLRRAELLVQKLERGEPYSPPAQVPNVSALMDAVLARLAQAGAPATDAGALGERRAELSQFTMSGR